jgi:hypothetical protein
MQLIMDSYVADAIIIKHVVTRYNRDVGEKS